MPLAVAVPPPAARRRPISLRVGLTVIGLAIAASTAMHLFQIGQPNTPSFDSALLPPSLKHLFGTDNLGRDVFLRTIYATLTDVQIGAVATGVPVLIGLAVGGAAGYLGGWVDAIVVRVFDFIMAFPLMVLVIAVLAVMGPGLAGVYVALIVKGVPIFGRLTRGELLALRERPFILAAKTLGFSNRRILFRHALPHVVVPNLVLAVSDMLANILLLAALSYLGLGVQPPTAEWGALIAAGQPYLLTQWWLATLPGLYVVAVGVGFSLTGEGCAELWRRRVGRGRGERV